MHKKLFIVGLVLILLFSVGAIQAGDLNQTDYDTVGLSDDSTLQVENQTDISDVLNADEGSTDKNLTELSSQSTGISYKGSYSVVLKDSNSSRSISNRTVNFVINNVNYNSTTDDNGVARVNLDLNCGKYVANVYFEGDEQYQNCSLSNTIEIKSPIKASDITKYYKGSTPFTAQFFDTAGNYLMNRAVTITVNGKSYYPKTNDRGIASLAINLKPGTYKIVSTDPITGFKLTTTFTILSTISASSFKKVEGEKFWVKFLKSNGKALAKKKIKIKFKGKTYKIKTNSKGSAALSLKKVKKGTYKVICYNRDGLSKTYTIKVFKRKASTKLASSSYTFLPGANRIIKAKFSTALGDGYSSGKTVKIKINGKTYSKKTDGNGVVSLNLASFKKGIYSVEYRYDGNKYFKPSKSTKSVTIYDTTKTSFSVKSTTHFGYGAGTSLKVVYNAGGIPLPYKDVTLSVAGKTYYKTTDGKGVVSIPINLDIGNYVVTYSADDQSGFSGTSGSFDIDVFKRSPSKVIWKCGKSYKDNYQIFKVLVTNLKGQHTSGGSIELTIDGETYYATVGSDGYAKFKTYVALGNYKVSVKFKGNNNYLESQTSKKISVKLSKFKNGLNERHAHGSGAYLKSSSHCKVGTKAIKKLVKSLTKGLTSKVDKAKAIFNYVRDTLGYSYYYNSKYGASGTLKHKKGNCVDHSNLLVAMYRTAGFHARYVHGRCKFSDGDVTGHVWTQVKIGKKWVVGDATSYRNSLGKVKNWNTKHYTLHSKYASIPF